MAIFIGAVVLLVSHIMVLCLGIMVGLVGASEIKNKEDESNER